MSTGNQSFSHVVTVEGNNVRVKTPPSLTVRAASTANLADLTAVSVSMDGVTLVAGDLVLLKDQTTGAENGFYAVGDVASSLAALTRVWPLEAGEEAHNGTRFFVQSGTVNQGAEYVISNAGTATVGTTALTVKNVAASQGQIDIPVATAILAAGTPMAAFADNASSNPGVTLVNSKAVGIRWNNNASQTAIWYTVPLPQDLDDASDISLHALVSKSGATLADAVTLTFSAFFQTVAALHDADSDCGGATNALTGDATAKTVTELIRTIAAADVPAAPCSLSFSVKPTDGTLGTDDAIMEALWIEFRKKDSVS